MGISWVANDEWPWAFKATQTFELTDNSLTLKLRLQNLDDTAMPAGLGWHPYFATDGQIEHDGAAWWPHSADFVPDGRRVSIVDHPEARTLKTSYVDTWSVVRLSISDRLAVLVTASPELFHLVIHQADGYSCIEPVSHVANCLNLPYEIMDKTGVRFLVPGETFEASINIRVEE